MSLRGWAEPRSYSYCPNQEEELQIHHAHVPGQQDWSNLNLETAPSYDSFPSHVPTPSAELDSSTDNLDEYSVPNKKQKHHARKNARTRVGSNRPAAAAAAAWPRKAPN
mmetsp:Transcript_7061/g.16148  ORF Transcript_7061/g.16148 Transcript_7061/m.16148 type:complete len:109 (+) Transcript_7061:1895-2221(+)